MRYSILTTLVLFGCAGGAPVAESQSAIAPRPGGGGINPGPIDCFKPCRSDGECNPPGTLAYEMCIAGECRINPLFTYCDYSYGNDNVSRNARGDRVSCGNYACDPSSGRCQVSCTTQNDCAVGWACNANGRCESYAGGCPGCEPPAYPPPLPPLRERGATGNACQASCRSDGDCGGKPYLQSCSNGYCVPYAQHCSADGTQAIYYPGFSDTCDPYYCNAVAGECYSSCRIFSECLGGHACSEDDRNICL